MTARGQLAGGELWPPAVILRVCVGQRDNRSGNGRRQRVRRLNEAALWERVAPALPGSVQSGSSSAQHGSGGAAKTGERRGGEAPKTRYGAGEAEHMRQPRVQLDARTQKSSRASEIPRDSTRTRTADGQRSVPAVRRVTGYQPLSFLHTARELNRRSSVTVAPVCGH